MGKATAGLAESEEPTRWFAFVNNGTTRLPAQ